MPARRVTALMHPLVVLLLGAALAAEAAEGSGRPTAGLCVVVPATTAADLLARTEEGRVLVHALVVDATQVAPLRAAIAQAGATGLVTVMEWPHLPALPYAERMVDHLVIDADALGARAPTPAEIERVLVPRWGLAEVRSRGAWAPRRIPLPESYGEWTHYFGDATNNPVNREQAGIPTGIRWIAGPTSDGSNHSYFGAGRVIDVASLKRSVLATQITTRNAFNGLPVWRQRFSDMKFIRSRRYESNVIAGDRFIRLRNNNGPLVALSLDDGREILAYDAMPITPVPPGQSVFVAASADGSVSTMTSVHEGVLYAASGDALGALDVATGRLRWLWKAPGGGYLGFPCIDRASGVLAVGQGGKAPGSSRNTAFGMTRIHGLDLATGAVRWTRENPVTDFITRMMTYEGGLYLQTSVRLGSDRVSLLALDAATGRTRWSRLDQRMPGAGTMLIYPGRMFLVGSDCHVLDLASGDPFGSWALGNSRCDVPRGGARFINNFGHFLSVEDPKRVVWERREVVRNSCGGATLPAYGLRYSTDNRCSCFDAVRGRVAQTDAPMPPPTPDAQRLVTGPAAVRTLTAESTGWLALLGGDHRRGSGAALRNRVPKRRWTVALAAPTAVGPIPFEWRDGDHWNGPLTAPTIADGRVYVAETLGHRLRCLDAATGAERWSFTVNGRIDGPPRISRGRVVFGSRDGHVYCLDAADGTLAWRFQAATSHRLICAYGQIESAWPVRGALPVVDGVVIAAAGYHPESDGGMPVYGLDLKSGGIRWRRHLTNARPTLAFDLKPGASPTRHDSNAFAAIFAANRITNVDLVANGRAVRLGSAVFEAATGQDLTRDHPDLHLVPTWNLFATPHRRAFDMNLDGPGGYPAVWGINGSRLYNYKDGKRGGRPGIRGRPICIDENHILVQGVAWRIGRLDCYPRSANEDGGPPRWQIDDHLRGPDSGEIVPSAMIIAGDVVVMTGTSVSRGGRRVETCPFEIRSLADGTLVHREALPTGTVDHGLAVAGGRLFMSHMDGSVSCWE